MFRKTPIIFFVLTLFLSFILYKDTHALSISPAKQTSVLDPGTEKNVTVTVTNDQKENMSFFPEIELFSTGDRGEVVFQKITKSESWISPITEKVILKPNETKDFYFKIKIPESAEPGTYYYALLINSSSGQNENVSVSARAGSLLFLYVSGEITENLISTKFETQNKFNFKLPINFEVVFKNQGTIHVTPNGFIKIKNIFNKEIAVLPVNILQKKVLAHGDSRETISLEDLDLKNLGPLRAELFVSYGVTQGTIYDQYIFWFIPFSALVFFSLVVGLIIFALFFLRRKKKYEKSF